MQELPVCLSSSKLKFHISIHPAWVTQHPPVHHRKNPILGFHGWDETVPQGSVYLVSVFSFPSAPFFSQLDFFPVAQFFFSFLEQFSYHFYFAHPWHQVFLGKLLPTPTHLLPFFLPTHLPPSSCWPPPHHSFCGHFHRQSFQPRESLSSSELRERKELQEFRSKLPSPPPFLFFFYLTTIVSLLFSSFLIFFCC